MSCGVNYRLVRFVVLTMVSGALVGGACSEDGSDGVATSRIIAHFEAVAGDSGSTEVEAELRLRPEASFQWVTLKGGDELRATRVNPVTLDGRERTLVDQFNLIGESYGTSFASSAQDLHFEVAFDRSATGRVSALDSWVTLPTDFMLGWVDDPVALTPAPATFSRSSATPYFVVWDPFDAPAFEPGDELHYRVRGDCIRAFEGVIDWPAGEDVLQLTGVLLDDFPPNDGMSCPIEVEITLRRLGTVDPAFAGGCPR